MIRRLHAVHVIAGLDPAYGGPSYSVPRLCEALAVAGAEAVLLSVTGPRDKRCETFGKGYADCRFGCNYAELPLLRDIRHSSALVGALRRTAANADVVHNHGLWLMPNVQAARAAAHSGRPLVVSPRGMLAPAALTFSRIKKRIFWSLVQGPAIRGAACIHATSQQEYADIRGFGLTNPIAVIPNGVDLPELAFPAGRSSVDRIVLTIGRIHPIKGLDRLLYAWAQIETRHPSWRLRITGPAEEGHDIKLRVLARRLGLARVSIEGPIYGDAKQAAYRDADIFVLPTLIENFGMAVAEALAAGVPVIATKGAPWSRLESEGCGWWIEQGVEVLTATLTKAMAVPRNSLKVMGMKGRAWMARDFSWDRIAREMLDVYRWSSGCADAPGTIRFG